MKFENIEPSNPKYTSPGMHYLRFQSPALGRRGDATIYLPPGTEEMTDLPMVVLLHGVFGSHWAWCNMGGAHLRTQELIDAGRIPPCGLVMPSDGDAGRGTGYVNAAGGDFESWIVRDVIECVRQVHKPFTEKSPIYLGGFSMGGFGAMFLGARHPELFQAISAHSSATHLDQLERHMEGFDDVRPVDLAPGDERGVLHWILARRDELPRLRFDCGADDRLIEYNLALHAALEKEGVPHEYNEFPGRHSWGYWHEHLADSLEFFLNK